MVVGIDAKKQIVYSDVSCDSFLSHRGVMASFFIQYVAAMVGRIHLVIPQWLKRESRDTYEFAIYLFLQVSCDGGWNRQTRMWVWCKLSTQCCQKRKRQVKSRSGFPYRFVCVWQRERERERERERGEKGGINTDIRRCIYLCVCTYVYMYLYLKVYVYICVCTYRFVCVRQRERQKRMRTHWYS